MVAPSARRTGSVPIAHSDGVDPPVDGVDDRVAAKHGGVPMLGRQLVGGDRRGPARPAHAQPRSVAAYPHDALVAVVVGAGVERQETAVAPRRPGFVDVPVGGKEQDIDRNLEAGLGHQAISVTREADRVRADRGAVAADLKLDLVAVKAEGIDRGSRATAWPAAWNRIKRTAEHDYRGEADDIVGTARGTFFGNALNWRYDLDLKVGRRTWRVNFDDWMFLQPDNVVLNQAKVRKLGIEIGTVTLFFRKPDDAGPSGKAH